MGQFLGELKDLFLHLVQRSAHRLDPPSDFLSVNANRDFNLQDFAPCSTLTRHDHRDTTRNLSILFSWRHPI